METPSLFDDHVSETAAGSDADCVDPMGAAAGLLRLQDRIRSLNEDRLARQDVDMQVRRRRAAVARLRRRVALADEIDLEYWHERRASLHLVSAS